MKKLLIIILIIIGLFGFTYVKAEEIKKNEFVINDWVDLYYSRTNNNNVKKGRFVIIRNKEDNNFAYCIEPLKTAKENYLYTGYELIKNINNINKDILDRISLLSYYGYMYPGHEDKTWYAITQLLIWKTVAPNLKFEILDKTKQNIITNNFLNYIQELEYLVQNHYKLPKFKESLNNLSIKKEYQLNDENNVLNSYEVNQENIKILNNKLIVKSDIEKEINIEFKKKMLNNKSTFVYYDYKYQSLMSYGKVNDYSFNIKLKFNKGKIIIRKIDKDTNKFEDNIHYSLKGTTFKLYDENNNYLNQYIVDKEYLEIDNLALQKYYLIEEKSGKGYTKSNEKYYINLNENNKNILKTIKNKKELKEINIIKYMGNKSNKLPESNIKFQIFENGILIKEVITDKDGKAKFLLPYGKYEIKQINSTFGYKFVNDFVIEINNNTSETYELLDLKIPDAGMNNNNIIFLIIVFNILIGLNIYDKVHNKNI